MAVNRALRDQLADALAAFMREEVKVRVLRAAAARVCEERIRCFREKQPMDVVVDALADWAQRAVWPTTKGCMAAREAEWDFACRALCLLRSDIDIAVDEDGNPPEGYWTDARFSPFANEAQWLAHRHFLEAAALPAYDPKRHNRPRDEVPGWIMWPLLPVVFAGVALIVIAGIAIVWGGW